MSVETCVVGALPWLAVLMVVVAFLCTREKPKR